MPAAYAETIPAAVAVVTRYFSALASRDGGAISGCMHYPFAALDGIEPIVVDNEAQLLGEPPASMDLRSDSIHRQPGSFDLLDGIAVLIYAPTGVGCSMSYSRYDSDGHKVAVCDGLYGITNNDGRWAIEWCSTIFTPAEAVGVQYSDAVEATLRRNRDWMLGYSRRDQKILNSTHQLGRRAHLTLSNPRENARNAREGNPMGGYRVQGVTSRLRVSNATPESVEGLDANFDQFASWAGGGVGEWAYTIAWPEGRVLHATVDKTHALVGYLRYTADHRLISETHSLSVTTYRDGRWGSAGGMGVMMYHDRSNDIAPGG